MADDLMFKFGEEMVRKLISLATDEFTLAWNFQTDLKNLEKSLKMVNALICDASSNNKAQLESVKVWLQELNEVAFAADVVLEDFLYETLRYKVEDRKRDKVLALISPSKNPIVFRQKLAHKIRKVKASVDEFYNKGTKIGLIDQIVGRNDVANTDFYNERLTHPFIDDDSKIVGRENDVLNVVKMLCDDDDDVNLSVMAIVGLGGQGKTTLAQLVCKNENVVKHFDNLIIWVCVSQEFAVTTLLNEMVQFFTGKNPELSNVQAIVNNELGPKLKDKRYLLVLDDVWNEDENKWGRFKSALSGISGARGSKVMVTTRSDKVASAMQASSHFLGKLSDEESWTMFKQRAFAHGGAPETKELTKIGTEIVKRCLGLPLAIKVIASMMYSKKSENDWLVVKNSQLWNIKDYEDRVVQTLKISYDQLSFSLKRCFCFCSSYSKDKVIEKNELIQCWMALGLLQLPSDSDQVMEDLGERHFEALLSMCLFQDTVKDEFGGIKSCKMHDIVHDLALITTQTDYSTLKSVALVSSKHVNPQSHLRVLVLNSLTIEGDSIKKMKHLRHLDISRTSIYYLLDSFTTCYNLHTIKFKYLEGVSEHIGKLLNLRHICVKDISWSAGNCSLNGIGRLTCLQTLPFFGVNREKGCHLTELESLNNLKGDLFIFGLKNVVNCEEAKGAFLYKKRNLLRLRLCWGKPYDILTYDETYKNDNDVHVLEGLEPHSNLQDLTIEKFLGSNFPQWMMVENQVLGKLVNLELHDCHNCERIPPLGHLQHLKVVKLISLYRVREIGAEFYGLSIGREGVSLFPVLRELVIRFMLKLERWLEAAPQTSVSNNIVFPCLEKLDIIGCRNLKSFPSDFPSLTELSISDIDSLALKELSRMQNSLTSLDLQRCNGSEFQPLLEDLLIRNNRSLMNLRIAKCDEFVCLPNNLVALEKLEIEGCENLTDIQNCLPSAREVHISRCSKLIRLPILSQVFPLMEHFVLDHCNEVVALPDIQSHTCLQEIKISYMEKITSMPELCKSLRNLDIEFCLGLTSFPDFRYLRRLNLHYSSSMSSGKKGPSHLYLPFSSEFQCLESLKLGGLSELKSLPDQIQHLTALKSLILCFLDGLESLPDWLGNLISLQTLDISMCEKLKYFPSLESMRRLVNLSVLTTWKCPLLENTKGICPEWRKISHIPSITLNGRPIKDE
jgi:hypothetical protein